MPLRHRLKLAFVVITIYLTLFNFILFSNKYDGLVNNLTIVFSVFFFFLAWKKLETLNVSSAYVGFVTPAIFLVAAGLMAWQLSVSTPSSSILLLPATVILIASFILVPIALILSGQYPKKNEFSD